MIRHKYVVFDFDGTIVDLHVNWTALREEVYQTFHGRYQLLSGKLSHMYETILCGEKKHWPELMDIIRRHEQPAGIVAYSVIDRTAELLHELPGFWIISNNLNATVCQVLNELNLMRKCHAIIGIDNVTAIKPSSIPFTVLVKITGDTDKNKYLYIGDKITDQEFAHNSGIDFMFAGELP